MFGSFLKWNASLALVGLAVVLTGCGKSGVASDGSKATGATEAASVDGGWWCVEHGVPEEECAQCDATLATKFKAKGDWCKEHNRPESQCFLCSPKRFEKFAARYEAKFGKKPTMPTE